jgi:hypothetical protein
MKKGILTLCAVLLFSGCTPHSSSPSPTILIPSILDVATFESSVQDFHQQYKQALFTTNQIKTDEAKAKTALSLQLWQDIVKIYKDFQPKEYLGTQNWKEKLENIEGLLREANTFVQNEQFLEAHGFLEGVRKELFEIRKQNNRGNLSDQMYSFHNTVEELIAKREKDLALITKLQQEIIPIAEKQGVPAYQDLTQQLQKMVIDLTEKEESIYSQSLEEIKRVFVVLYLQFG